MNHFMKQKGLVLGFLAAFLFMGWNGISVFAEEQQPTDEVEITATKTLEGRELQDGEFEFELYEADANGNVTGDAIQTKTNDKDGNITFDKITYTEPGEYNYVVKEKQGTDENITYDSSSQTVKVTVTKEEQTSLATKPGGQSVEYSHEGSEHSKRVIEDGAASEVFCINKNLSPASSVDGTKTRQIVTESDLTYLESELAKNTETNSDWKPTASELYRPLVIALYNGAGVDYSGLQAKYNLSNEDFYEVTQYVVFWLTLNGKPGAPSYAGSQIKTELKTKVADNTNSVAAYDELLEMAMSGNGPAPQEGQYNLYVYQGNMIGGAWAQSLVRLEVAGINQPPIAAVIKAVLEGTPAFTNVYSETTVPTEEEVTETFELGHEPDEEGSVMGAYEEPYEEAAEKVEKVAVAQQTKRAGSVQTGLSMTAMPLFLMAMSGLAGAIVSRKQ